MDLCLTTINAVRSAKNVCGMPRRELPRVTLLSDIALGGENGDLIQTLSPCGTVRIIDSKPEPEDEESQWYTKQLLPNLDLYVEIDTQRVTEQELKKVSQKLSKLETKLDKLPKEKTKAK